MIDQSTIKFLLEVSGERGAEWLTDNKAQFDFARRNLVEFILQLSASAGLVDPRTAEANAGPRKCLAKAPISKGIGSIAVRVSLSQNAAATYFMYISPNCSYSGRGASVLPPHLARIVRQTIASQIGKGVVSSRGCYFRDIFERTDKRT